MKRMLGWIFAVYLLLLAWSCAAGVATVTIKPNAKNEALSDIFVRESPKGKAIKFLTIGGVQNYGQEYRNGHLYIIRLPEGQGDSDVDPNWTQELWRYNRNGKGTKLWASRSLDFRVRDDEGLVAILSGDNKPNSKDNLYLLAQNGKMVKSFPGAKMASLEPHFVKWEGKSLWLKDQEEMEIAGFIEIDSQSMVTKKYEIGLDDMDDELNTSSKLLAYSDYPVMFDTDSDREFKATKATVSLYVYNLKTKQSRVISRSIAKDFDPKWVGPTTLVYNNPKGKGRIRKDIRF